MHREAGLKRPLDLYLRFSVVELVGMQRAVAQDPASYRHGGAWLFTVRVRERLGNISRAIAMHGEKRRLT